MFEDDFVFPGLSNQLIDSHRVSQDFYRFRGTDLNAISAGIAARSLDNWLSFRHGDSICRANFHALSASDASGRIDTNFTFEFLRFRR
jgi:hypothetical protein